jgi:hypothetical protein
MEIKITQKNGIVVKFQESNYSSGTNPSRGKKMHLEIHKRSLSLD